MQTININSKLKSVLIIGCLLFAINSCSNMQTTNSGILIQEVSTLNVTSKKISIVGVEH